MEMLVKILIFAALLTVSSTKSIPVKENESNEGTTTTIRPAIASENKTSTNYVTSKDSQRNQFVLHVVHLEDDNTENYPSSILGFGSGSPQKFLALIPIDLTAISEIGNKRILGYTPFNTPYVHEKLPTGAVQLVVKTDDSIREENDDDDDDDDDDDEEDDQLTDEEEAIIRHYRLRQSYNSEGSMKRVKPLKLNDSRKRVYYYEISDGESDKENQKRKGTINRSRDTGKRRKSQQEQKNKQNRHRTSYQDYFYDY